MTKYEFCVWIEYRIALKLRQCLSSTFWLYCYYFPSSSLQYLIQLVIASHLNSAMAKLGGGCHFLCRSRCLRRGSITALIEPNVACHWQLRWRDEEKGMNTFPMSSLRQRSDRAWGSSRSLSFSSSRVEKTFRLDTIHSGARDASSAIESSEHRTYCILSR